MWYVYMLQCSDATLYTGITSNLDKRLAAHNKKLGAKYTATRTPVKLIWSEVAATRSDALKREYEIKLLNRSDKLRMTNNLQEV